MSQIARAGSTRHQGGASRDRGVTLLAALVLLAIFPAGARAAVPNAVDDAASTTEDAARSILVRANDRDPDGDTLAVSAVNVVGTRGRVSIAGGGTHVVYDPRARFDHLRPGQSATDSFGYTVKDPSGGADTARVTVTVSGVNDAPTARPDIYANAVPNTKLIAGTTGPGPAVSYALRVSTNDVDPDDALTSLTFTAGTASADGGRVTMNANGSFVYVPPVANSNAFDASDTFTYTVKDGGGKTATGTVTITFARPIVWYVNSAASTPGDGRSTSPFNSLAPLTAGGPADSRDGPGDILFVFTGSAPYASGIKLEPSQRLLGQPHGLVVGGRTLVPPGGSPPRITSTAGSAVVLASATSLQGLIIGRAPTSLSGVNLSSAAVGTVKAVSVDNPAGKGLDLSDSTVSVNLASLRSAGSATQGIRLNGVRGSVVIAGGSITTAAGNDIEIVGGTANVSYAGSVTNTAGRPVLVQGRTAGTVTFSGPIRGTGGAGILLANNPGSVVRFTGGLDLATGTSEAFAATGGGTVSVAGTANVLRTTTGVALRVQSTTIGVAGLTFRSISSSGAPSGIILTGTGTAAGLRVTGDPSLGSGSGGLIAGSTGPGVLLVSARSVDLARITIQGGRDDGIRAKDVNGFTLTGSNITDNGDAAGEHGLDLGNVTGTARIDGSRVIGSAEDGVRVVNIAGTLSVTVSGSTIGDTASSVHGNDGLLLLPEGTARTTLTISGSTFRNARGDHLQVAPTGTGNATTTVTVDGSHFIDQDSTPGGGIVVSPGGATTTTASISGNTVTGARSAAIAVNLGADSTSASVLRATLTGNTVGATNVPGSGSASTDGIAVVQNGAGTLTTVVSANQIRRFGRHGILLGARDGKGSLNATVTGNTVAEPDVAAMDGLRLVAGVLASDTNAVCADIGGASTLRNDLTNAGHDTTDSADLSVRARGAATVKLPGYTGSAGDIAAVRAYLAGRNDVTTTSASIEATGPFSNGGTGCPRP